MSSTTNPTPGASSNASQTATVISSQAPLQNTTNGAPVEPSGVAPKSFLAKKLAGSNPTFVSPTDNMMTPVSQKLNAAKKGRFNKGAVKPMPSLFAPKKPESSNEEPKSSETNKADDDDDENPF